MAGQRIWTAQGWEDVIAVPANMVTTDTSQTIAGVKTLRADLNIAADPTAESESSPSLIFASRFLNYDHIKFLRLASPSGRLTTDAIFEAELLYEGASRVFSPGNKPYSYDIYDATTVGINVLTAGSAATARAAIGAGTSSFSGAYSALTGIPSTFTPAAHTHGVTDLTATGTRNATTFLRGDNTWATITAPGNMLTTDTAQDISGVKTFATGTLLMTSPLATGVEPYSDANPPGTLMMSETGVAPATPPSGLGVLYTLANGELYYKNDAGTVTDITAGVEPYIMAVTGTLTVATGKSRVYLEGNYVIESVRASVNTASVGASIIVDVNLNGTSIFTTQGNRPTITAGANTALANLGAGTTTTVASGQYLTVDVDQIGTTTAGSDLTVVIRLRRV